MKYLHVSEHDGRYVTALREVDVPVPRAGEVLVRVAASGLNRADLSQIAGRYPPPPGESEILGLEVSGIVEQTGAKVCALLAGGGHAEYVAVPAGQVFPAPANIDPVSAAAIPEAYLTAFVNLVVEGAVSPGAAVLVHAGASGVGLAAIQLAKLRGARVAATTRTRAKLAALARAGADIAVDAASQNFVAEIESRWGADSVGVVLDPVGAATLPGDLAVLATGGRIILIAMMGGARPEVDLALVLRKRARLIGSTLRSRDREEKAALVARFRQEVLPAFDAGALSVAVDSVFPPARATDAFQRMRENRNTGKILLDWRQGAAP
ncbi:MAG TPA: NAD(P)H-quinone oxidoreductase [Gemmatimonadales bacterium]|nr:NAD(P)H-quinone oxidoreductase [Gemmatimonadales bacterium]